MTRRASGSKTSAVVHAIVTRTSAVAVVSVTVYLPAASAGKVRVVDRTPSLSSSRLNDVHGPETGHRVSGMSRAALTTVSTTTVSVVRDTTKVQVGCSPAARSTVTRRAARSTDSVVVHDAPTSAHPVGSVSRVRV